MHCHLDEHCSFFSILFILEIQEVSHNIFQQEEDVDFTLNKIISNNDYLMIKGSNATGLNSLTKKIVKGI